MRDRFSSEVDRPARLVGGLSAVGALCFVIALLLPVTAAADCCVCTDCATVEASCSTIDGCDFDGCEARCLSANCSEWMIDDAQCSSIPECRQVFGAPAGGPALHLGIALVLLTVGMFGVRRLSLPTAVRAASFLLVVLATAAAADAVAQLRLTGRWQLDADTLSTGPAVREQWTARVTVGKDGALSGTVALDGFTESGVASVHGTLSGGEVSGTLREATGSTVAEFEGIVENNTLQGTFNRTGSGETGTFSWGISGP